MRHVCPWPAILILFRSEWRPHPHPFFVLSSAIARLQQYMPVARVAKGVLSSATSEWTSSDCQLYFRCQLHLSPSFALRLPGCGPCTDFGSGPRRVSAIHHGHIVCAPSNAHARDDFVMSKLIWSHLRIVCHCDPQRVGRPSRTPPWTEHWRKPRFCHSIYPLSSPMPSLSPRYKAG